MNLSYIKIIDKNKCWLNEEDYKNGKYGTFWFIRFKMDGQYYVASITNLIPEEPLRYFRYSDREGVHYDYVDLYNVQDIWEQLHAFLVSKGEM